MKSKTLKKDPSTRNPASGRPEKLAKWNRKLEALLASDSPRRGRSGRQNCRASAGGKNVRTVRKKAVPLLQTGRPRQNQPATPKGRNAQPFRTSRSWPR
jgi:hypothetical protein